MNNYLLCFIFIPHFLGTTTSFKINNVIPRKIFSSGGFLTINGDGFAEDQFNFENTQLGNKVILSDGIQTQECIVDQYRSTTHRIKCDTGQIIIKSNTIAIYVYVDGVAAVNNGQIFVEKERSSSTPQVSSVLPQSGPPGTRVRLRSDVFVNQASSLIPENAIDSGESKITSVSIGGISCDLDSSKRVMSEPWFPCDTSNLRVGDHQVTVKIQESRAEQAIEALRVSATQNLYMFQTYPVIEKYSPSSGSINGGTKLTVEGKGFEAGVTSVYVAGENCKVQSVTKNILTCTTPAEVVNDTVTTKGGRGLLYERWNSLYKNEWAELSSLNSSTAGYNSSLVDSATVEMPSIVPFTGRLSGLFFAPVDGVFNFFVASDGEAVLYLSESCDPQAKKEIATSPAEGMSQTRAAEWGRSDDIPLKQGQYYYIEAMHKQQSGAGRLSIGMVQRNTSFTPEQISTSSCDQQQLYIRGQHHNEIQFIDLGNLPSGTEFHFAYGSLASEKVTYEAEADNSQNFSATLENIFQTKCEYTEHGEALYSDDYEVPRTQLEFQRNGEIGLRRTKAVEAYCGLYASWTMDTVKLFVNRRVPSLNVRAYPYVCFAVMGKRYSGSMKAYVRAEGDRRGTCIFPDIFTPSDSWQYKCVNIIEEMSKVRFVKPGARITMRGLVLLRRTSIPTKAYVDSVYIGNAPRIVSRMWSSSKMKNISTPEKIVVTRIGNSRDRHYPRYQLLMAPKKTSTDAFPLIGLVPKNASISDELAEKLFSEDHINSSVADQQIPTDRQEGPPRCIAGTWALSFKDKLITGLNPRISRKEMYNVIETLTGSTGHVVEAINWCQEVSWNIYFKAPGDYSDLRMNTSGIIYERKFESGKKQIHRGGLTVHVIGGDHFRTIGSTSEVTVVVDRMVSGCHAEGGCSFQYSEEQTPTINRMTVTEDKTSKGMLMKIIGTSLGNHKSESSVMVGKEKCQVISSNEGQIQCWLNPVEAGRYEVNVEVAPYGFASQPSQRLEFIQAIVLDSVVPPSGSASGGTKIVLSGQGFPLNMSDWKKGSILIGGRHCIIKSATIGSVECLTPATNSPGNVAITVSFNDQQSNSNIQFRYFDSSQQSTRVTSVSPRKVAVVGGQLLTIRGSEFGSWGETFVQIGDKECAIDNLRHNMIRCFVPSNPPGMYPLTVSTGNDVSGISEIEYELRMTAVSPAIGSVIGGTQVRISGAGFGNDCAQLSVKLGDGYTCEPEQCSDVRIDCTTRKAHKSHTITNKGLHYENGPGYKWDNSDLTIEAGDWVEWQWERVLHSHVNIAVWQTQDSISNEAKRFGFNSGTATPKDSFKLQFPAAGVFYYSGPEIKNSNMRGTINVTEPPSQSLEPRLFRGAYEADQSESRVSSMVPRRIDGCTTEQSMVSECSIQPLESNKLQFIVSECMTPVITKVRVIGASDTQSSISGHAGTRLEIEGVGFGGSICQNRVLFGNNALCAVTRSNNSIIHCEVPEEGISPFQMRPIVVNVFNRGLSQFSWSAPFYFSLTPRITSVTPSYGSVSGGFLLHLRGTGFPVAAKTVTVMIGSAPCEVHNVTRTEITCVGGAFLQSSRVRIALAFDGKEADFSQQAMYFTYTTSGIADVTDINVNTIRSPTTIEIRGSRFGKDSSKLTVTLSPIQRTVKTRVVREAKSSETESISEDLTSLESRFLHYSGSLHKSKAAGGAKQLKRSIRSIETPGPNEYTDTICTIITATDRRIQCRVSAAPAGQYRVMVNGAMGYSVATKAVTVDLVVSTISPNSGSIYGGTLVRIAGFGFHANTTVDMGGSPCVVLSVSELEITCRTSSHPQGTATVSVFSGLQSDSSREFHYSLIKSPSIESVTPSIGQPGSTVTLTGRSFEEGQTIVTLGSKPCDIDSVSGQSLTCKVPSLPGGNHSLYVQHEILGKSNEVIFAIPLEVSAITPNTGSFAGGTLLKLSGRGFSRAGDVTVTLCGTQCTIEEITDSQLHCRVGGIESDDRPTEVLTCDVILTQRRATKVVINSAWRYDSSLTPTISFVSPNRGGTAGGTTVTITGEGFANSGNTVTIDGSTCVIRSESSTDIICITEAHASTIKSTVTVHVPGKGYAASNENGAFHYVDRWSSVYTWGGESPPKEDDFVVIPQGKTVLLDTSTPVLAFLLIDGGELIFDDEQEMLELNSKYILILKGGSLKVGSEENPYQNKAIIRLHGHVQSTEIPLFGAKVLAVRNGSLDLHGQPVVTWAYLATTASSGSSRISMKQPVAWKAGDEIIIASTGARHSMNENEKKTIAWVSNDGFTVGLTEELEYTHVSVEQILGGVNVETRAEVGLLTRNVKVEGNINEQFLRNFTKCPFKFNSGQHAIQSCFHAKFNDETVGDQFGATIMLFGRYKDQKLVQGRIEYVEITEAGQAYQVGRYPVHFHMNGDVSGSYVRGCAVHHTYNRAITIHGVDNLLVEHNVVYDNMGHAIFMEDGIEKHNIIQYNLAIYTRGSSSLLNVDVTPASYWITNPDNIVRHNAAAGGTHFGFWYNIKQKVSGVSYTQWYEPHKQDLGEFFNNTAHTFGRYGLWVFSKQSYQPRHVGRFGKFLAWRCGRGAEVVASVNVRLENFTVLDNSASGMSFVEAYGSWGSDGPGISGGVVVGHSDISDGSFCMRRGIELPRRWLLNIDSTVFVNFDRDCAAVGGCRMCEEMQGGFPAQFRNISFSNVPNKVSFKWRHEHYLIDTDGSLTGEQPETTVLPQTNILPKHSCSFNVEHFSANRKVPGAVCKPGIEFHRMAWGPSTKTLWYKKAILQNEFGITNSPFMNKRLTHAPGWMAVVVNNQEYNITFENAEIISNISYTASFYDLRAGDKLTISHPLNSLPDFVKTLKGNAKDAVTGELAEHGDWKVDDQQSKISYLVAETSPKRIPISTYERRTGRTQHINLKLEKCFYEGCSPPVLPPVVIDSSEARTPMMWSSLLTWKDTPEGYGGSDGRLPEPDSDILIPGDKWIVADIPLPPMKKLYINGILEIQDKRNNVLRATHIVIRGGKLIAGRLDEPFQHEFTISLRGDELTTEVVIPRGPTLGAKALGVFGELHLHGQDVGVAWTKLQSTAAKGSSEIVLVESVDWKVQQEIVITTTSYEREETEVKTIQNVSADGRTITLDSPLQYEHLGVSHKFEGVSKSYDMRAKVGLLTRNIRIEGEHYERRDKIGFGGRVLVGSYHISRWVKQTGSAYLSNVELRKVGQHGHVSSSDPRYSLVFLKAERSQSYVKKCSFNYNFNTAVGVDGSYGIAFEDNVVYYTAGTSIIDKGGSNVWKRNLVTSMIFSGSFNGKSEKSNNEWNSAFSVNFAYNPYLEGNVVAGGDRSGYQINGDHCSSTTFMSLNNEAHGVLHGVHMFGRDGHYDCSRVSGFYIWRAYDYGVFFHITSRVIVTDVTIAESFLGILPMVYLPPATLHKYEDKFVKIRNNVIIGRTPSFTCGQLKAPKTTNSQKQYLRAQRTPSGGMTGIVWSSFTSGLSNAPVGCSFADPNTYPALHGVTFLQDNVFVNYGVRCGSSRDSAIASNTFSGDAQHPIVASNNTFINVDHESKVYIYRPSLGLVNPTDCVDMDCDGQKKAIINDLDGSIIGNGKAGTIIPMAEYEWNGDPRRGLGDYRIPIPVITNPNGTKIQKNEKAPFNGIYGNKDCKWEEEWNAYQCHGIEHRMMVIESMDSDSEIRRVSPVAVIGEPGSGGYVDLINGPMDRGWCFGYTCQERLSTFYSIVALNRSFEVTFTGTAPQVFRLHLLNVEQNQAVLLKLWLPKPQLYKVLHKGVDVLANNAEIIDDSLFFNPPADETNPIEYLPTLSSQKSGTNYYHRHLKLLYVLMRGPGIIEIRMEPLIVLRMGILIDPVMFYEEYVIRNLADILGIPKTQIVVVNVVREDSRRRKRGTTELHEVLLEVELKLSAEDADMPDDSDEEDPVSSDDVDQVCNNLEGVLQHMMVNNITNPYIKKIKDFKIKKPRPPPASPPDDINNQNYIEEKV